MVLHHPARLVPESSNGGLLFCSLTLVLWAHHYVNGTQFGLSFPLDVYEALQVLNPCLEAVMGWMRANKLKLNPDKMEVL